MLDAAFDAHGVALDASRAASRRAARAHPRIGAVRGDVWRQIPLGDAAVDLALSVFAPHNGPELARVLRPGAALIVVTPSPTHLHELATLHTVGIDPHKCARLHRQLVPALRPSGVRHVTWTLQLSRLGASDVLRMGPAGRHLGADLERRLAGLPEPMAVTGAVELRTFRRPASRSRGYVPVRRGRRSSRSASWAAASASVRDIPNPPRGLYPGSADRQAASVGDRCRRDLDEASRKPFR